MSFIKTCLFNISGFLYEGDTILNKNTLVDDCIYETFQETAFPDFKDFVAPGNNSFTAYEDYQPEVIQFYMTDNYLLNDNEYVYLISDYLTF